jgi:hypothetical protein
VLFFAMGLRSSRGLAASSTLQHRGIVVVPVCCPVCCVWLLPCWWQAYAASISPCPLQGDGTDWKQDREWQFQNMCTTVIHVGQYTGRCLHRPALCLLGYTSALSDLCFPAGDFLGWERGGRAGEGAGGRGCRPSETLPLLGCCAGLSRHRQLLELMAPALSTMTLDPERERMVGNRVVGNP